MMPPQRTHANSEAGSPSPSPPDRTSRLLLAGAALALLLPIWAVAYPPLVDYPNHLARSYILAHVHDFGALAQNYRIDMRPLPYLTVDLALMAMMKVVSAVTAGRLLLSGIVILWVFGAHLLGRAFAGRGGASALLVAFFAYNSTFYYGFLNYNLALALFFITLAVWVLWRGRPRTGGMLLVGALALLTYFSHLAGFILLGLAVAGVTVSDVAAARRIRLRHVLVLLPFVPGGIALVLYMLGAGTVGSVSWGTVGHKIVTLLTPFTTYDRRLDAAALVFLAAAAAIAFSGRTRFGMRRAPLAATAALLIAYVASPYEAMTGSAADARFVMPLLACALFVFDLGPRPRAGRIALALVLAASLLKVGGVWAAWTAQGPEIACQVRLLGTVDEGARVFPLYLRASDPRVDKRERGMIHVVNYATIERRALVPTIFTYRAQQVLELTHPPRQRDTAYEETADVEIVRWDDVQTGYDYVWACRLTPPFRARLESLADPAGRCEHGELWRVRRNVPPAPPAR